MSLAVAATPSPGRIDTVVFEWQPDVWLLVLGIGVGYFWALRSMRASLGAAAPIARRQPLLFGAGLVALGVTTSWPLDTIGDQYLFSAHMLQYLLMSLVAAPMLLAGVPGWMLRELTRPVRPLLAWLARPLGALLLFNLVLVVSHWPVVVEAYTRSDAAHFGMHALWLLTALVFWLPVLSPIPEFRRLNEPLQMGYLFLSSVIPTIPASFLTFAQSPIYDAYAAAPRLWGITPLQDLQAAGLIMKIGGGFLLWTIIIVIFFRWSAVHDAELAGRRQPRRDPSAGEGRPTAVPR